MEQDIQTAYCQNALLAHTASVRYDSENKYSIWWYNLKFSMNVWHSVQVTFYEVRCKCNRSKLLPPYEDLWRNPTYRPPNQCLLSVKFLTHQRAVLRLLRSCLRHIFFEQMIDRIGLRYRLSMLHYPGILFFIIGVGSTVYVENPVPVFYHKLNKRFPGINWDPLQ